MQVILLICALCWLSLGLQRSQGSGLPHYALLLCCPSIHTQLSKYHPFIDLGRQRRTNTWSLKQRVCSAWLKQAFPVLPSLVKMQVGRGNIYILLLTKIGLHNNTFIFAHLFTQIFSHLQTVLIYFSTFLLTQHVSTMLYTPFCVWICFWLWTYG